MPFSNIFLYWFTYTIEGIKEKVTFRVAKIEFKEAKEEKDKVKGNPILFEHFLVGNYARKYQSIKH